MTSILADGLSRRAALGRTVQTDVTRALEVMHPDFDPADVDRATSNPTSRPVHESTSARDPRRRRRRAADGCGSPAGYGGTRRRRCDRRRRRNSVRRVPRSAACSSCPTSTGRCAFYSERLGFTIVYAASGNAVVEYGGGPDSVAAHGGLLRHRPRRSATCTSRCRTSRPPTTTWWRRVSRSGTARRWSAAATTLELWKAAFRDPDGHGVALTEWRCAASRSPATTGLVNG